MQKVQFVAMGLMLPLISNLCQAQTRKCDMEITLTSPVKGAVIAYGETLPFSAMFKNNGPDDLKVGDTILYATPQTQPGQAQVIVLKEVMAKGASFENTFFEAVNENVKNEDVRSDGEYCFEIFNPIDVLSSSSWEDPEPGNNRSCASFVLKAKPGSNSINSYEAPTVQLNCYPNPATDRISIALESFKGTVSSIRLLDISGREVMRKEAKGLSHTANGNAVLDVAAISAGTYIVEVQADQEKARTKVVIQD